MTLRWNDIGDRLAGEPEGTRLRLARPLGARVLVSATDGGAVPVTRGRPPAGRGGEPASR